MLASTSPGSTSDLSKSSSSTCSSAAKAKMERLIGQLKALKISRETPECTPTKTEKTVTPAKKGDGSKHGDTGSTKSDSPAESSLSPKERVARFLQRKKAERIDREADALKVSKDSGTKVEKKSPPVDPSSKSEKNPYVLPDYVAMFDTVYFLMFYTVMLFVNDPINLTTKRCEILTEVKLIPKVLDSVKKLTAEPPTTFPLQTQYVKSIDKARAAGIQPVEEDDDEDSEPGVKAKTKKAHPKHKPKSKAKSKAKSKSSKPAEPKSSCNKRKEPMKDSVKDKGETKWDYNRVRMDFIKKLMGEFPDLTFGQAREEWDNSKAKKDLLKNVSVQELKRRKFIPKGSDTNPWSD